MDELLDHLKKEENGFAIDRGLATSGCQIFDMFTSPIFRRQISKVRRQLLNLDL